MDISGWQESANIGNGLDGGISVLQNICFY
jgi:hypothetical protein